MMQEKKCTEMGTAMSFIFSLAFSFLFLTDQINMVVTGVHNNIAAVIYDNSDSQTVQQHKLAFFFLLPLQ